VDENADINVVKPLNEVWQPLKPFVRGSHLVNLTAFSIYASSPSCSLPVILVVPR